MNRYGFTNWVKISDGFCENLLKFKIKLLWGLYICPFESATDCMKTVIRSASACNTERRLMDRSMGTHVTPSQPNFRGGGAGGSLLR